MTVLHFPSNMLICVHNIYMYIYHQFTTEIKAYNKMIEYH